MKRVGFAMQLKPGTAGEYKRLHDEAWPVLLQAFRNAGIRDYVIFLDSRTNTLFASQKVTDTNTKDQLSQSALIKDWWKIVADLMETNPDLSPVVYPLEEVFSIGDEQPQSAT